MRKLRTLPAVAAVATSALGMALLFASPHQAQAAPTPTNATLRIQKGGDRTGPQAVDGLAGATFDIIAGTQGSPPSAATPADFTCGATGGSGLCSVDLPGRTGGTGSGTLGYWIREKTAPNGFHIVQTLGTATTASTPATSQTYNLLFTGNIANNTQRTFPEAGTGNALTSRGNFWPDVRTNPDLPGHCGLNIAVLIDTSGSTGGFQGQIKSAAKGFVDALTGTPSQIALYTFADTASARLASTPVSDAAGAAIVNNAIDNIPAPGGTTNWDQGLFQIAAATTPYDAVIMLTDGNPTVYGPPPPSGPGDRTRFREVENGIFSANALKAEGTKVVAVGVGAGVSGAPDNLKAISGPVAGSDYVQTDYPQLAETFREIALQTCAGTISVVKKVIAPGGTPADATPAGGWTFSTETPEVHPQSGVTADGTGAINFSTLFPVGSDTTPVTIDETPQSGFTLHPIGGKNATCMKDGSPAAVTNNGALGFTTDAVKNSIVTCTVYNDSPTPPASVRVLKKWNINGTMYDDPQQPPDFQAELQLTGQTTPSFGTTYNDYLEGESVTVGETVLTGNFPPNCTNVESGDLGPHTLAAGLNTFHVVNTVTCTQKLTLFKHVINPYGPPAAKTEWTLNAFPPGDPNPAITGKNGVTGAVDEDTPYSLGESTVPGYKQEKVPNSTITPPSTGSWHCVLRLRDGSTGPEFDGLNGTVTVQLGESAECTANNTAEAAKMTLKKVVDNTGGGPAKRTDWILHADPVTKTPPPTPLKGRDGEPSVTNATVNPLTGYALTESGGPKDYVMVGDPTCLDDNTGSPVPAPGGVVTPQLGQHLTCEFTNKFVPGPPTPTPTPTPPMPPTGTVSGPLAATGAGLFLTGAALFFVARRSRRTDEE